MSATVDFPSFLVGKWKRTLEWHGFGGDYEHIRSTNSVVGVDDDPNGVPEQGTRLTSLLDQRKITLNVSSSTEQDIEVELRQEGL